MSFEQVLYPDDFNGCFAACPDPIDFRAYCLTDIYNDPNCYYTYTNGFRKVPKPCSRNMLGQVRATLEQANHMELAIGSKTRSAGQFDIWEAVYSPQGDDGYPKRLYDKLTGDIDIGELYFRSSDRCYRPVKLFVASRSCGGLLARKFRSELHCGA